MKWSKSGTLTSGLPLLAQGEQLKQKTENTLLRAGTASARGTLFLTTKRLIHVDDAKLALEIPLTSIIQCRIISRSDKGTSRLSVQLERQWICSICYFSNAASTTECATCGVKMQEDAVVTDLNDNPVANSLEPGECPQCTFKNHPSLAFCELCGSPLRRDTLASGSELEITLPPGSAELAIMLSSLSQSSTSSDSDSISSRSASVAPDESRTFGVKRLHKHSRRTNDEAIDLLDKSLASVDGFMAVKDELVTLAARLGSSLTETATDQLGLTYYVPSVLGATSPEAIAHEIAGLLIGCNVLARAGGMLTFHDLYALYNRARGISLISSQELLDALVLCEPLDLPLRCRTMKSGLRVVESRGGLDQALERLLHWINTESQAVSWRASSGFSARDVGEYFGYAVQIAMEELLIAESRGQLCRDENISGLRFFPNLIAQEQPAS